MNKIHRLEAIAEKTADILIKNCTLVNVLSGELEHGVDIAVAGNEIVGVGSGYTAKETIDAAGRYVYPGLIDAHIHLESTKLTVPEAGRLMARFGTAAVITDPHEIGNVAALDGIAYQMDSARGNGFIHVFFTAPSCVPTLTDPAIETAPSALSPDKLRMLAGRADVVGLGELMNVPGILMGDPDVAQKMHDFSDSKLALDGHAPMLSGIPLNACIYMGIQSDHESTDIEEAREKLRRGMVIMIREGSSEKNLDALLPLIDKNGRNLSRLMFASDDLDPYDLIQRGHINHLLKRAVAAGIDPIAAIQMATLSPAAYFHIDDKIGSIRPGALADIVIAPDLINFMPDIVMHEGKIICHDGIMADRHPSNAAPLRPTMNVILPELKKLAVCAQNNTGKARVIEVVPGQILTHEKIITPKIENGIMIPDPEHDIAKVCVFERHRGSGAFGTAFVHGYGIKRGAAGSSVGHDSHNLIVVGTDDAEILKCAEIIRCMEGGQAAVLGDRSETLPLSVAGLMSPEHAENVIEHEKAVDDFCHDELGMTMPRPMAALSFMALPVIPSLRITDQGLFSIAPGGYPQKVDIFL